MSSQPSPNFAYVAHHDARLVALATQAEEAFASDPPTSIAKLRLFAEVLAKRAAAKVGLLPLPNETQQTLVDRLFEKSVIGALQRSIFHDLRRAGYAAVHENREDANEALHQLRMACELAVWFQRSFGDSRKFDPGPFVPASAAKQAEEHSSALQDELARLREQLVAHAKQAETAKAQIEEIRLGAEKGARFRRKPFHFGLPPSTCRTVGGRSARRREFAVKPNPLARSTASRLRFPPPRGTCGTNREHAIEGET